MRSRDVPDDDPALPGVWTEWLERGLEDAKAYTRARPLEALLAAFVSGLLLALFLARPR
jgi:hypothetical protein